MPESRNRTKHHHGQHAAAPSQNAYPKAKRSAAFVVAILAAILGFAVSFFTLGGDVLWMVIGTGAGAIVGFFVGHIIDNSLEKK